MAWDGSGNFSRTNGTQTGASTWANARDAGNNITASQHDTHDQDFATAIDACLTQNNESKPTADFKPNADNTYSLGSTALRWVNGFFAGFLRGVTHFLDANGNELLKLGTTTSAVNEVTVTNAATGNPARIHATGETNVGLQLEPKGTGKVILTDGTDNTKRVSLDASGIATATTRVWTAPDYDCRIGNLPAGIIVPYGGSSIPSVGWLDCDGTVLAQATYPALYAAIGTTWNIGGEAGTDFRLPNLCGRIAIGSGTGTVAESVTDAAIDTTANSITVASNATKWITGMEVVWTVSGTPPTTSAANQLDNNDTVYVIRIDATTIKVASSRANAQNGTVIDITAAGSGTFTLTHTYTARTVGQYGGEEAHALSSSEELLHGHTFRTDPTVGAGSDATGGFMMNNAAPQNNVQFTGTPTDTQGQQIGGFGGNAAMNIMQPFAVVKYIISY